MRAETLAKLCGRHHDGNRPPVRKHVAAMVHRFGVHGGDSYDVIVVGARVAGSTLAALLGDAGHRVLIVDRATFPSATISTHFFRGGGLVSVLDRLELLDRVLTMGPPLLDREYDYPGGAEPTIAPPQDPGAFGYCLSVRREPLDDVLAERACRSDSVEFLQHARVSAVWWQEQRVCGVRLETPKGERVAHGKIVVGADGRHSCVARAVRAPEEERQPGCRALYYRYVRGFPAPHGGIPDGAEFSLLGDEMAYVFPSDAEVTCIALSVNREAFRWMRKSLAARFSERLLRHPGIAVRLATVNESEKVLGSGPEWNYVRVPAGPGWALVGDAGMHQDPWTGVGMDLAGVHATFLAEALLAWLGGDTTESKALADYHRRRNEHALPTYRFTTSIARDLRQFRWADAKR
jgi:menaquinone-9 beta-reductase